MQPERRSCDSCQKSRVRPLLSGQHSKRRSPSTAHLAIMRAEQVCGRTFHFVDRSHTRGERQPRLMALVGAQRRRISSVLTTRFPTRKMYIILDMIVERGRKDDLGQPSNRRLNFWLKGHLLRFAYVMLGHLALTYFLVRLPAGTYEIDLVTKVYDGMLIPFVLIALLEGSVRVLWGIPVAGLGFFWGMLTMLVSLILLINQPETWVVLGITVIVTVLAIVALIITRRSATNTPSEGDV